MFHCIAEFFYPDKLRAIEEICKPYSKNSDRYKKVNIIKQQLKISSGKKTMEFRDHFKNGVDLQNLSSRKNVKTQ
jgi:hypothetical protein